MRFLFVDRILENIPGQRIFGIKHITADDFYVSHDESGRVHFASSLIGETIGQLAAWNVMHHYDFKLRPVAGLVSNVIQNRLAYVGETLVLEAVIDSVDERAVEYHGVATIGNEQVFKLGGAVGPMLPMDIFIDAEEVRLQFEQIDRPGVLSEALQCVEKESLARLSPANTSLTFDAILACSPGVSIQALKCVNFAAPYFADHFPKKPVLPLTILIECKINLVKEFLKRSHWHQVYTTMELRRIKMKDFISPGDCIQCTMHVKSKDEHALVLLFKSVVEGKLVCVMELTLR